MKLGLTDLKGQLKAGLKTVYVVSGDEPLQVNEACDAIRASARAQGFTEREVHHVETGFDWDNFLASCNSLSLFSDRRMIELRIASGKPGDKGAKALRAFAENPPPDVLLLLISGKLEAATQKAKWFTALTATGAHIAVWPIEIAQLPNWLTQRLRAKGMRADADAVTMIVERVEGNLLAAAQEIDKLFLLHGTTRLDADAVAESVVDSSRYNLYDLMDVALLGDSKRVVRMLQGLRGEGAEPVLILWALSREIRSMEALAREVQQGQRADQVVAKARIWAKRQAAVKAGLNRHSRLRWQNMLSLASRIDLSIKGMAPGNVWDELLQLCLRIAGVGLFKTVKRLT